MKAMRHHRIIGLLAVALVCGIGIARADTVTVNWTPPTANTNGSAIAATGPGSLTNYRVEYGTCVGSAFGVKAGEVTRAAPATGTTLNLQPGTTCVRAFVSNTFGKESAASNVTSKVIDQPVPNPPTNLTVTDPVAYDVRPNESTFAFDRGRPVGLAKIGAACDEERTTGDDFYALERPSRVRLNRQPRSAALVARCASGT
jgi:hypothetical protein